MERYELNMQRQFQSLIPMTRVSWAMANAGLEVDFALFASIRFHLQRNIFFLISTLKKLKEQKVCVFSQVKSVFFTIFQFKKYWQQRVKLFETNY
jgi:hypothetical protein